MKKLTLLCTVLLTAATLARSAAPTSTAEQPAHTTRPNTFMIQSYQAGSSTEIDDLKVIDLGSGEVVYENTFSAQSDATRGLNSYYWPEGGNDTENYVKNGPKTRVENGKFILETTGFNQDGSGGYESHSEVEFSEKLPVNFRVEFTARRLQWPGHFHFMLYRQEPEDAVGAQTLGGSFSSKRPNKRPLDMIRMAASGHWFQELGILTNFGTTQQAWAQKFAAPAGSLLQPHKLAVELNNNTVSYYIDDVLLQETQVAGWEVGTALKATMKPQVTSGKSNAEDIPHQKPAPNTQQASMPQKFDLNDLIGDNLIDANGNPIDSATLKNKFIGIYFSAHWCGPCRQFTPKLVEFRNQIPGQFEVVFASADQDAPAMLSYMKEAAMPWPALPFASPKISSLNHAFQIRSIPTFVVLDPTGRLASPNARNDVTTLSPKDALSKWKIDAEKAAPPKPALVPPPVLSSTSENPPKDISIVPGKSLLGCPIGSTEEEVVKKLGKPMANFRFGENATALLYYNGTALLRFHNGKLLDGNFSASTQLRINHFHEHEVTAYSLPNGIAIGADLQKLKDVLGNKLDIKNINESGNLSYLDEGLKIKLQYNKYIKYTHDNEAIKYSIDSIQIENPNSPFGFNSIEPGKSIFGCSLGASEAEIIKILGEPQGKIDLGQNKIGLLYDNFCNLLILRDGVLWGGVFKSRPIFGKDLYHGNNMVTLTNGIALGASLAKANEILGEKFDASKSQHTITLEGDYLVTNNITFQEGDSLVTIQSYSRTPNGVSHEEAAKDINNYTIHSIQIDPISKAQPVSPSTGCAIPKKTTFPARQNPEAFNPAEMVAIEGGTLSEKSNLPGVKVDSFFIGKYEVTNAEWLAIQTFAQMNGYSFSKDPRTDHPEMPVEGVTRREAMLWCNAKSEKEGRKPVYWLNGKVYKSPDQEPEMNLDATGYRLPTEPEWEWAARGGTQSKGYEFSGSNIQNEVAWHGDDGEKWARLVGTKKPNELGIHDMSGNVYEWVWDINIPTHGIQGGSYMSGKWHLILNHRNSSPLRDFANEVGSARSLGFRVARNHSKET